VGSRPMQKYQGSCHCGAVRFEIETDFPELTMCDCSICRRKNALMVKVHESQFRILTGEETLRPTGMVLSSCGQGMTPNPSLEWPSTGPLSSNVGRHTHNACAARRVSCSRRLETRHAGRSS
jgi:hypothetical protein